MRGEGKRNPGRQARPLPLDHAAFSVAGVNILFITLHQFRADWRAQHADRTLTGLLVQDGGVGRWPE